MKSVQLTLVMAACSLLVVLGLVMLPSCTRRAAVPEAQPVQPGEEASDTQLPHPSELWPMPEDNGYDDFLAAIELLPEPTEYQGSDALAMLQEGLDRYSDADLREFLATHQPALDKLRQALDKPFVFDYQWLFEGRPWHEQRSVEMMEAKRFAHVLLLKGAYHQRRGEHEQALDSLRQILTLARNVCQGGTLADRLVSMAIKARGLDAWKKWISTEPSPDVLRGAGRFLQELDQEEVPLWKTMVMAHWECQQELEDLYAVKASAEELHPWKQAWPEVDELLKTDKNELLQESERYAEKVVALARMPLSEALEQQPPELGIASLKPLVLSRDTYRLLLVKVARHTTEWRGVRIMVAIELYRQAHKGQYPSGLHDLVPDYLAQLPKDPYNDQDFIYRVGQDEPYYLYVVGVNKQDDGGVEYYGGPKHGGPDIVVVPGPEPGVD